MEWMELLITLGVIIATATAVVIGNRVQQKADRETARAEREAIRQELENLKNAHRRDYEVIQAELRESRERIDNLILYRGRNGRQQEKN